MFWVAAHEGIARWAHHRAGFIFDHRTNVGGHFGRYRSVVALANDQGGFAVLDQLPQPDDRISRIQHGGHAAGLDGAKQSRNLRRIVLHHDADAVPLSAAARDQRVSQPVGRPVEFVVGRRPGVGAQCDTAAVLADDILEYVLERLIDRERVAICYLNCAFLHAVGLACNVRG